MAKDPMSSYEKAAAIIDESVLLMTWDGLATSGNGLKSTTIVSDLEKYKSAKDTFVKDFQVYLTSNGETQLVGICRGVSGLSVSRGMETIDAGNAYLYQVKVPGNVSYGEVTLSHLYTNSTVFLDWLINGADRGDNLSSTEKDNGTNLGGALLAKIEIVVGGVTYTLQDAFPVSWKMSNVDVLNVEKIKDQTSGSGSIPLEEITIVYGQMTFSDDQS